MHVDFPFTRAIRTPEKFLRCALLSCQNPCRGGWKYRHPKAKNDNPPSCQLAPMGDAWKLNAASQERVQVLADNSVAVSRYSRLQVLADDNVSAFEIFARASTCTTVADWEELHLIADRNGALRFGSNCVQVLARYRGICR